eukprot:s831_g3.t1
MVTTRGRSRRLDACSWQHVLAAHAEPLRRPGSDASVVAVGHWGPRHARIGEVHKAGRGSWKAAATDGAHAFRFGRFGHVGTGEVPNDCVGGLVAGGRHEVEADPQVSAAGGNARLAGQMIDSSAAIGAPTMQAGGLQHAANVGESTAARISGVVHIWLGGGAFQTDGARRKGRRLETWGDVTRRVRRGRGRRHLYGCSIMEGFFSPVRMYFLVMEYTSSVLFRNLAFARYQGLEVYAEKETWQHPHNY